MFLFGILAFLQITLIPGAIILKALNFQGTIIQRMAYAFALSLIASYILVFFLTAIHLYNQAVIFIVLGGELIGLAWLYKKEIREPFFEILQKQIENLKHGVHSFLAPDTEQKSSNAIHTLLTMILLALALTGVLWTVRIFISNIGSVFDAWDAVVAWNRWALNWASGQIPLDSGLYPQLIPANWSLTYVMLGSTIVQAVAKGIMPLFAVLTLLSLFDLGLETKRFGFFISGILAQLLFKKFLAAEITNGYVDVAVAFFGLLAIHALVKTGNTKDISYSNQYLLLGGIFAAGAAVTKQPGLYIFVLYPVLAYIHVVRHTDTKLKSIFKKYLIPLALVSLIPLSWYVFKQAHFMLNIEDFYIQEYFDVTSNTYGNVGIAQRIVSAFSNFDKYLILFVIILTATPLLAPLYRALALFVVIPYPFLWVWVASYDTRNLAIFIPIFALTAGIAAQEIYSFLIRFLERTSFFRIKNLPILVFLFITVILGSLALPSERIAEQQIQLQKLIFSPTKNEKIYALIEQDGPDTKILTNYPVQYLPGLKNNQVQFGFKNFESFLEMVEDPSIRYIFFPAATSSKIKSYLEDKINDGEYELVFDDKEWISYKMVRIDR